MKENELRIGNLIRYRHEKDCKVSSIGSNGFETSYIEKDQANGSDDLRDYEPIPLNEEWLLRFGFIKNQTSWTNWKRPNHTKEVRIGVQGKYLFYNGLSIISVHQLQNLYFALTGTELSPN